MSWPSRGDNDSYRPRYGGRDGPPPPPPAAQDAMYHFRGNRDNTSHNFSNGRSRRGFSFRAPNRISDRPLLRSRQDSTEKEIFHAGDEHDKFRNVDDLTDSDEMDMEGSDDQDDDLPATKRVRLEATDDVPKWSNPNPYTSLPPPNESTGKKTDFVKLIRKARNAADKTGSEDEKPGEDFISFDLDGTDGVEDSLPPPDAPTGPRASNSFGGALGKRKRGDNELLSRTSRTRTGRSLISDGMVLIDWCAVPGVSPTPWVTNIDSKDNAGTALHKEIIDFYDWVKPRDFETAVRADVIHRLSSALNRIEAGELKAFGSYAAGLYLPTGDMDLVFLQRRFNPKQKLRNGYPLPVSKNFLFKTADFLRQQDVAQRGTVQVIPSAKVPIIKFVERLSGLKVDLSFNNDTGITANDTFQTWKTAFPAMPIIVSIIKHYLMIRGLNDVAIGGLGGFSAICLVTSLIQHLPLNGQPPNLGQLLVEFFNLYGNLLDRDNVAIRLDPPGYVDKLSYAPHRFNNEKPGRLTIIDPNRPENNISGGTREIDRIADCFSHAYDTLQGNLARHADLSMDEAPYSFLEDLLGGNFEAYDAQRTILRKLHFGGIDRQAAAVIPPPPPPISRAPIPPPPSTPRTDSSKKRISSGPAFSRQTKPCVP